MPQYILQTKELCKEFAHTAAVNRVSMNIQQGDIYGFIGENGAGKTTFMRMVAGLASPTSGTIKLFGQENLQAGRHHIGRSEERRVGKSVDLGGRRSSRKKKSKRKMVYSEAEQ